MRVELLGNFRNGTLNRSVLVFALLFCLVLSGIAEKNSPAPAAAQSKPAASTGPVASPYVVGVGDILDINVWKEPELSRASVAVRPTG